VAVEFPVDPVKTMNDLLVTFVHDLATFVQEFA
jgi:hypothetical protein